MEQDGSPGASEPQGLSFSVGFDEPAKRMPKHFGRSKRKPELSEASIAEKQRLAEKRRKVRCKKTLHARLAISS